MTHHPRILIATALLIAIAGGVAAQWGGWGRRFPPKFPGANFQPDGGFAFCRILYRSVTREYLGHGWNTDYPDSDINLMRRLGQLTKAPVRMDEAGEPDHMVVLATDLELFQHPFVFMSDVGTVGFTEAEVASLADYLLRGGLLWVDDFWGDRAWRRWSDQIGRALPPDEYPIVDLDLNHPVFSQLYTLEEVPQIPSIQHWYRSGGSTTSEMGSESAEPHLRGIFDTDGRLMVLMSHNTDIADGWEREGDSQEFFELFSLPKAYPLGVNVVLYSLLH